MGPLDGRRRGPGRAAGRGPGARRARRRRGRGRRPRGARRGRRRDAASGADGTERARRRSAAAATSSSRLRDRLAALRRAAARPAPAGADLAAGRGRRGGAGRRRRAAGAPGPRRAEPAAPLRRRGAVDRRRATSTASATGRAPTPRSRCAARPRPGRCSTGCSSCGCPTRSPSTATSSRACSRTASPRSPRRGVDVLWPRSLGRDLTATHGARPVPADVGARGPAPHRHLRRGRAVQLPLAARACTATRSPTRRWTSWPAVAAPLLRLRGNWTVIDPAIARKARKRVVRTATPAEAIAAALTGVVQLGTAEQPVEEQVAARRLAAPGPRAAAQRRATSEPVEVPAGAARRRCATTSGRG